MNENTLRSEGKPDENPTGPVPPATPVEDPNVTPHPTKFDPQAQNRIDQTMSSQSIGNKAPEDAADPNPRQNPPMDVSARPPTVGGREL